MQHIIRSRDSTSCCFIAVLIILSGATECISQNVNDYNSIDSIIGAGHVIQFETSEHHFLQYNDSSDKWSYDVNQPIIIQITQGEEKISYPDWAPHSTYNEVQCTYNSTQDKWALGAIADEGAEFNYQFALDLVNTKFYRLSLFNNTLWKKRNIVWIGGKRGVIKLELKSNNQTEYLTLPHPPLHSCALGNIIYYCSREGVFLYDPSNGISTVIKLNTNHDQEVFYTDILPIDSFIVFSGSPLWPRSDHIKGEYSYLYRYNVNQKNIKRSKVNIGFIGHLCIVGQTLLAFGQHTEGFEGGETRNYGGIAFIDIPSFDVDRCYPEQIRTIECGGDTIAYSKYEDMDYHIYQKWRIKNKRLFLIAEYNDSSYPTPGAYPQGYGRTDESHYEGKVSSLDGKTKKKIEDKILFFNHADSTTNINVWNRAGLGNIQYSTIVRSKNALVNK
jgi:hypothetical protein